MNTVAGLLAPASLFESCDVGSPRSSGGRLLGRHLSLLCCWDEGNNWCKGRIRLEGSVVAVEGSGGRWWVVWLDIFDDDDDVRQVSVSKAVCSYHGVYNFVFVFLFINVTVWTLSRV
jgi:hypothetical protein